MNIVYLYTEIMPYTVAVFEELAQKGHCVYAYYLDSRKLTPYVPPKIRNVSYYKLSNYDKKHLINQIDQQKPDVLLVAGWANSLFRSVARHYKKKNCIPIVCPIDTQYLGRLKQILGILSSPFYVRKLFTHIWVPGARQYHFARLLGFSNRKIIMNSLTCQNRNFNTLDISYKLDNYPKRLLFVGRYHPVKGLDILLKAWDCIDDKKGWRITLVGNGPMKDRLIGRTDVDVFDFMSHKELLDVSKECGIFILPSIYEPWALVLNEFTAAGLPIICSDACGASSHLVIDGYNGYTFKNMDVNDLKCKLELIISQSPQELYEMAVNSRKLSEYTNSELSAASLLSSLYR